MKTNGREVRDIHHPMPPIEPGEPIAPIRRSRLVEPLGQNEGIEDVELKEVTGELRKSVEGVGNQLRSVPMQLADNLKAVVEAMSELIEQHIKLARVELKEDVKVIGTNVGMLAAFVPLVIFGYLFLCVAAGFLLARYVPIDAAFLIVAGFNLGVGAVGILLAVRKLSKRKMLAHTKDELQTTAMALRSTRT